MATAAKSQSRGRSHPVYLDDFDFLTHLYWARVDFVFPYIIPTQITIYQAAAAPSALVFMLTFIGVLIPIMLFYNIYNYVVFRGKVVGEAYGE